MVGRYRLDTLGIKQGKGWKKV
uniref:Uncharacterized protein n=1 Tax=Solanum lycopersicum TaxID=4081 RepID=A0A3Q7I205_SOLLC